MYRHKAGGCLSTCMSTREQSCSSSSSPRNAKDDKETEAENQTMGSVKWEKQRFILPTATSREPEVGEHRRDSRMWAETLADCVGRGRDVRKGE